MCAGAHTLCILKPLLNPVLLLNIQANHSTAGKGGAEGGAEGGVEGWGRGRGIDIYTHPSHDMGAHTTHNTTHNTHTHRQTRTSSAELTHTTAWQVCRLPLFSASSASLIHCSRLISTTFACKLLSAGGRSHRSHPLHPTPLLAPPTSLNDLRDHWVVPVCLLQLGCRDPDLPVCGDVLSCLVQHLPSVLVRLQFGQRQPQLREEERGREGEWWGGVGRERRERGEVGRDVFGHRTTTKRQHCCESRH